jgi:hypothetical protein
MMKILVTLIQMNVFFFCSDYTSQIMTLGTHVISNSKCDSGSSEEHEQSVNEGLG